MSICGGEPPFGGHHTFSRCVVVLRVGVAGSQGFVVGTREMTIESDTDHQTRRPTEQPPSVTAGPMRVADFIDDRLTATLDHEAITLAGVCRLAGNPGFTLDIDMGGPLGVSVAVELVAGTHGVKYRAVSWGSHEPRADAVAITECYSHTGVVLAALREAESLAPSTVANQPA